MLDSIDIVGLPKGGGIVGVDFVVDVGGTVGLVVGATSCVEFFTASEKLIE